MSIFIKERIRRWSEYLKIKPKELGDDLVSVEGFVLDLAKYAAEGARFGVFNPPECRMKKQYNIFTALDLHPPSIYGNDTVFTKARRS
jgi:hypothetical protein